MKKLLLLKLLIMVLKYNTFCYTLNVLLIYVCDDTEFLIESASENECEVHEPEYVDTHGVGLEG